MPCTLALDLGTRTGWALRDSAGRLHSGMWKLDEEQRELTLWSHLDGSRTAHDVKQVVVEKAIMYPGHYSGSTVGPGLAGVLRLFVQHHQIPLVELTPSAVKKCATGKGNAKKALVRKAMQAQFPDQEIRGDDQADALAVLYCHETGGLPLLASCT